VPSARFSASCEFRLGFVARQRMVRELAAAPGPRCRRSAVKRQMREAYRINDAAVLEVLKMLDRRPGPGDAAGAVEVDGIALPSQRRSKPAAAPSCSRPTRATAPCSSIRLAAAGIPVSMVFRESRMMDAGLFERGLSFYWRRGILATDGLKAYGRMLGALRSNRVGLHHGRSGRQEGARRHGLRFLGKDMPMPAGPAQLARHRRRAGPCRWPRWRSSPCGDSRSDRRSRARRTRAWKPTSKACCAPASR
jgi:KDO2-lipid IV(A) lauroyltransferase